MKPEKHNNNKIKHRKLLGTNNGYEYRTCKAYFMNTAELVRKERSGCWVNYLHVRKVKPYRMDIFIVDNAFDPFIQVCLN